MIFQIRAISITFILIICINYYQLCSGFPFDGVLKSEEIAPEKFIESGVKSAQKVAKEAEKLKPEEIAPEKLIESGVNSAKKVAKEAEKMTPEEIAPEKLVESGVKAGTKVAEKAGKLVGMPLPTKFIDHAITLFGEGAGVAVNMIGTSAVAKDPVKLGFWEAFIRPSVKHGVDAFADQF